MKITTKDILIVAAIVTLFGLACGCKSDKLASDVSAFNSVVSTAATKEAAVDTDIQNGAVLVSGTVPSSVTNALSYGSAIIADAQAAGQLFSAIVSQFQTSTPSTTAAFYPHRYWTAKGVIALRRYHIDPMDRHALAKLMTAMRRVS